MKIRLFFLLIIGSALLPFFIRTSENTRSEKEINQLIVNYHNRTFGVDYLFDQNIPQKNIDAWMAITQEVKKYALAHYNDIFGNKDPLLAKALRVILKANNLLIPAIQITYKAKGKTSMLIKMATVFKSIEKEMENVINRLNKEYFLLKGKQSVQKVLLTLALFIQETAKKANKDTRMGHRALPQIVQQNNRPIPMGPPTDMPPTIEEYRQRNNRPTPMGPPTDMPPTIEEYRQRNNRPIPMGPPTDMPPTIEEYRQRNNRPTPMGPPTDMPPTIEEYRQQLGG
jgi:hypothetical protein